MPGPISDTNEGPLDPLPECYSLTARESGIDGWTALEMRTVDEKYTVGDVEDRFAPLFIAAPAMLDALVDAFEELHAAVLANVPMSVDRLACLRDRIHEPISKVPNR